MIERKISPEFAKRVPHSTFVQPQPGKRYWRLIEATYHPDGARVFGPDRHILVDVLDSRGNRVMNIPVTFFWANGKAVSRTNKANGPYAVDFPMDAAGYAYGVYVGERAENSDITNGMGLGRIGSEHMGDHVTYRLVFCEAVEEEETPPAPNPPSEPPVGPPREPATVYFRDGVSLTFDNEPDGEWIVIVRGR